MDSIFYTFMAMNLLRASSSVKLHYLWEACIEILAVLLPSYAYNVS